MATSPAGNGLHCLCDGMNSTDADPLLSAAAPGARRRTTKSPTRLQSASLSRRESFKRDFEHAAAETYLLTGLAFKLLRYLGPTLDHETSSPHSLCNVTFAWLPSSFI